MKIYLNGEYVDAAEARVPIDDRGFLFADGVYELTRIYNGVPFLFDAHMRRLREGLAAIQIEDVDFDDMVRVAERLQDENRVNDDGTIYMQVTRGVAPRAHAFPKPAVPPSVFIAVKPFRNHPAEFFDPGVAAVTVPDNRWARCDLKVIALLPNVLANQAAKAQGAFEALFIKDGVLIEGSHSNLFGVIDGELRTYPESNYILPGITRRLVLDLAAELDIPARETPIFLHELPRVEELFLSGTTTEIMPVATVDGKRIGQGTPGAITRRLREAFAQRIGHPALAAS
jgi:D-alanine transaminase